MIGRNPWITLAACVALLVCSAPVTFARAADEEAAGEKKSAASKDVDAEVEKLLAQIKELEDKRPSTEDEYYKIQKEIKDAAAKIMGVVKDPKSQTYQDVQEKYFSVALDAIRIETPRDQQQTLQAFLKHLGEQKIGAAETQLALALASNLEQSGNTDAAAEAFVKFGDLLARSDDPVFSGYADLFAGAARRLKLVGNKMELKGSRVDGEKFDLESLAGKVVLVDFWATWCGPCLQEIPNMKANFEAYHDQGFEIVGVSLDANREDLETFLHQRPVPWTILHEKDGSQHPAAKRYGVLTIPLMILVGRDGKVLSTQARGEELNDLLKKQFAKGEKQAQ